MTEKDTNYIIKPFGKWWLLKDKSTGRVIFKGKSVRDIDDYLLKESE